MIRKGVNHSEEQSVIDSVIDSLQEKGGGFSKSHDTMSRG
jgi:hypothetical protein